MDQNLQNITQLTNDSDELVITPTSIEEAEAANPAPMTSQADIAVQQFQAEESVALADDELVLMAGIGEQLNELAQQYGLTNFLNSPDPQPLPSVSSI